MGTENNTNYHIAWKDIVVSATECSDYMCRFQNEINKINPLKMNQNMNLSTNKLKSYHKKKTNVQNFTPNQWNGFIVNFLEKLFEVEALSSHKNVKSAKSKSSAGSVSLEDAQKIITCVLQIHDCFHFNVTMYQKSVVVWQFACYFKRYIFKDQF